MTSARVQPFCRKHNINIGCYDGFRVCPRNITERNTATKMHNNHFCLIWKTDCVSFNKAIEDELEPNFKVVDIVLSDKHVKSFIKYEYKSKKVQSQSTNMVVYDIETFNTDRAVPYANCMYRLSKLSGKYNRDISEIQYQNCLNDCFVFKGLDNINEMLDYVSHFKGEPKRVNNEIVKYNLYLLAHKGSDFDSYVVLNNLPQWRTVVSLNKNGTGIVSTVMWIKTKRFLNMRISDVVSYILKILLKKIGQNYKKTRMFT